MAELFFALGFILIIAKGASYLSIRLGQPSMVGALIAGILLGPGLLDFTSWPVFSQNPGAMIAAIAELGFLMLVFSAGLELRLADLARLGRVVFLSGWLGVIVTMLAVPPLMLLAGFETKVALFAGVALAGTGNGVAAQIVLEMDMIRSKVGIALLYAAMIDDILIMCLLSMLVAFDEIGAFVVGDAVEIVVQVTAFIFLAMAAGWFVLPWLAERIDALPIQAGALVFAVASALLLGWAADKIGGMAPISGAFIAGLCLGRVRDDMHGKIEQGVAMLNDGLLIPVFLINLGLRTDIRALHMDSAGLILALLVTAVLTKLIGCGIGARLGGFDLRSALHMAIGMVPRGAVGLAVGSVGLGSGLMPESLFPQIVLVILGTTIIAPPFVRRMNRRMELLAEPVRVEPRVFVADAAEGVEDFA